MWPRPGIPAAFPWRLEGWPEPRPRRSGAEGAFRAVVQSGQTISYGYDVIGRRLPRTLNNGTAWTGFVHAGGMEIGEINSAGQYLVRYVPGPSFL